MVRSFIKQLLTGKPKSLDPRRYAFPGEELLASDEALEIARKLRANRLEAIFLHGVMPRSGTTFVGALLGLHPSFYNYPREIKEFPFLRLTEDIYSIHEKFEGGHPADYGKIPQNDFLMLSGSSILAYLNVSVPKSQHIFLKVPNVEYLPYFNIYFPFENQIVLMRDGRDVVASTISTWPKLSFVDICRQWDLSARLVLTCNQKFVNHPNYYFTKYEDVVTAPEVIVKDICSHFRLDVDQYPFEKIAGIPLFGSSVERIGEIVSWKPVEKPKDFNPIGRWTSWSEGRKRIFKRIAGQTLIDFGYSADLDW